MLLPIISKVFHQELIVTSINCVKAACLSDLTVFCSILLLRDQVWIENINKLRICYNSLFKDVLPRAKSRFNLLCKSDIFNAFNYLLLHVVIMEKWIKNCETIVNRFSCYPFLSKCFSLIDSSLNQFCKNGMFRPLNYLLPLVVIMGKMWLENFETRVFVSIHNHENVSPKVKSSLNQLCANSMFRQINCLLLHFVIVKKCELRTVI